jgi:hypothetical protein
MRRREVHLEMKRMAAATGGSWSPPRDGPAGWARFEWSGGSRPLALIARGQLLEVEVGAGLLSEEYAYSRLEGLTLGRSPTGPTLVIELVGGTDRWAV